MHASAECKYVTGVHQGQSQGVTGELPEAEALFAFRRSIEAANLSTFLKFENAKKTDICVVSPKGHRTVSF